MSNKTLVIIISTIMTISFVLGAFAMYLGYEPATQVIEKTVYVDRVIEKPSTVQPIKEDNRTIISPSKHEPPKQTFVFPISGTGSMLPLMNEHSHIVATEEFTQQDIKIGDIVIYQSNKGEYVVHRIIDINGFLYLPKGDNNNCSDSWICFAQIKYLVVGIQYY